MPFYNYTCKKCEHKYSDLAKRDELVGCPECGTDNGADIPAGAEQLVMETRDAYRGVKVRKNNEAQLRRRMIEHRDKYELEETIEKHGMNEAKRHGWLKKIKKI